MDLEEGVSTVEDKVTMADIRGQGYHTHGSTGQSTVMQLDV